MVRQRRLQITKPRTAKLLHKKLEQQERISQYVEQSKKPDSTDNGYGETVARMSPSLKGN